MATIESLRPGSVVVGVDGSQSSLTAAEAAAREASLSARPLHVVHACVWPLYGVPLDAPIPGLPEGGLLGQAEKVLEDAKKRAAMAAPDLEVTGEVITGDPAPVLLRCAEQASIVVIGDRGLGGFSGLLLGSVAVKLVAHSSCPVLVVRGEGRPSGPIVVAIDGSAANEPAIGYAFAAADRRAAPLVAVHTWTGPEPPSDLMDMLSLIYDPVEVNASETRLLSEALVGWRTRYPDVSVSTQVMNRGARTTLIESSKDSQLIVVGSRGRGGFAGLLLGSVSQSVLHHAHCPVVVVPGTEGQRT